MSKPACLAGSYPEQWSDPAMAASYRSRPPYSGALIRRLLALRVESGPVLDVGAGTGDLGRPMALRGVDVHALEPAGPMIEIGRRLPGGEKLTWNQGTAEEAPLGGPYGLVMAGESVHWLDFERALPRIRNASSPGAWFAVATRGDRAPDCWASLQPLIDQFSTNRDYEPYNPVALIRDGGWFVPRGRWIDETQAILIPTEIYLRSLHSRNGLSPARMGPARTAAFDEAVREVLDREVPSGFVRIEVTAQVTWGRLR